MESIEHKEAIKKDSSGKVERTCSVCGRKFLTDNMSKMYCSHECQKKAWTIKRTQERRRKSGELVCHICGKHFESKRCDAKYCSEECSNKAESNRIRKLKGIELPKEMTCGFCGKKFTPDRISAKYCCKECADNYYRLHRQTKGLNKKIDSVIIREKKEELLDGIPDSAICRQCGKEFKPKRLKQRCCSLECSKKFNSKVGLIKRTRKRASKHKVLIKVCPVCHQQFECDSNLHNKVFCSKECKRKNEQRERRANGERRDSLLIENISSVLPSSLDKYRAEKGKLYFRYLFQLPKEEQFAEMANWTEEDHNNAIKYFNAEDVFEVDDDSANEAIDINVKQEQPIFDEDNQGCDIYSETSAMRGM